MGLTVVEDNKAKAPYGYKGKDWVGFDNPTSLIYKIDHVVKKNSLRGVMFWAIDLDDFSGQHCGQGKYPLMNAVKKYLTSNIHPPSFSSPSPPITTTTTQLLSPSAVVTSRTPLPVTTRPGGGGNSGSCVAVSPWKGNANMDAWCVSNCERGNCPAQICQCL